MIRVDAQHGFLPPAQDPVWLQTILHRNRFGGSIYLAPPGLAGLREALETARQFPYIRAVIPQLTAAELPELQAVWHESEALVRSVRLRGDLGEAVPWPEHLLLEAPAVSHLAVRSWYTGRLVLDGLPSQLPGPEEPTYLKLTGFTLPVNASRQESLREALRTLGPERLLFATGWPQPGQSWKECLAAFTQHLGAAPMALREQLLGETACRLYRIAVEEVAP